MHKLASVIKEKKLYKSRLSDMVPYKKRNLFWRPLFAELK